MFLLQFIQEYGRRRDQPAAATRHLWNKLPPSSSYILFVFFISLVHHHHSALLRRRRQALIIMDRLLTFPLPQTRTYLQVTTWPLAVYGA